MERFHHPNLLELLAHETVREGRGGRAVVYFLTPAYLEGSLVDFVERVKAGVGGRAGEGEPGLAPSPRHSSPPNCRCTNE